MNRRKTPTLVASLILIMFATAKSFTAPVAIPNPVLFLIGQEPFTASGKQLVRYNYSVANFAEFPAQLFAEAPSLPPYGKNTKAARTWVDVYDSTGKRLQGFCAFSKPGDLNTIWFALEEDVVPPSYVYIELTDRKTSTKYKSNLADTTL